MQEEAQGGQARPLNPLSISPWADLAEEEGHRVLQGDHERVLELGVLVRDALRRAPALALDTR